MHKDYQTTPLLRAVQIFLLILIVIGVILLSTPKMWVPGLVEYIIERQTPAEVPVMTPEVAPVAQEKYKPELEAKNSTYLIDGTAVTLANGAAFSLAVPGFASETTTGYFGNEVFADINADGFEDAIFLLTQETGGSGLFFYVVATVSVDGEYKGSQAFFLGDRIAPQTTQFEDGVVTVNYADRAVGEPFSVPPSIGKSARLQFDAKAMLFTEVAQ